MRDLLVREADDPPGGFDQAIVLVEDVIAR
jgi:hypothetical protein